MNTENAMNTPIRRVDRLIWVGIGLTLALLLLALLLALVKIRAANQSPLPVSSQVAEFTLTNQNGAAVSLSGLRGRVWVADIIFTRCPGPCLKMSKEMKALQQALPASSEARLVTLTTDPEFDTPPVLKTYAERFGADPARWLFLTGTKKQIADLASESLKLTAVEQKPEERENPADLFIHSTIFVVVDKQARVRAVFQTTGEGVDPELSRGQILATVARLERER